jgi:hypothetical protein
VSDTTKELSRNRKTAVVVSLGSKAQLEIPLPKGGEVFWLGPTTIGHVVPDSESKTSSLYAIDVRVEKEQSHIATPDPPTLLGSFPTATVTNFVYSPDGGTLVFSDNVYSDGDIKRVNEGDKEWENRGNSALVFDEGYERHWDTWTGPKKSSLFSVSLTQSSAGKWQFGENFVNVLLNTTHVSIF